MKQDKRKTLLKSLSEGKKTDWGKKNETNKKRKITGHFYLRR